MSSEVSSINNFNNHQGERDGTDLEELETLDREQEVILTPNGDPQYHVDLFAKVNIQGKAPNGDIKDSNPTGLEHVEGTTHIGDPMLRMTPIRDVIATQKTHKEDNGGRTRNAELKTTTKDDSTYLTTHVESLKTVKTEKVVSGTLKGHDSIRTPAGEHKTVHGDGSTSLNRNDGGHSTSIADKLHLYRP